MSDSLFDKVKEIQAAVNSEHAYKSDASGYGIGDFWDFMSAGQSGDCEDFSLTKMQDLIDYGMEAKNLRLMLCAVETGQHHAVLAIITSNRGTLILDNRYDNVKLIGNVPYRFYAYQNAGQEFKSYTAKLAGVSIEYMNCHAAAFADGDEVIVEFTDQDFSQPKVIGFKENPENCDYSYYAFMGLSWGDHEFPYDRANNHAKYNSVTGIWQGLKFLPTVDDWPSSSATWSRNFPGSGYNSSSYWIFGGIKNLSPGPPGDQYFNYPYPYLYTWDTNLVLADRYDKTNDSWTVRNTLPTPKRNNPAGFMLLGKTHLVGGCEYQHNNTALVSQVYVNHDQYNDLTDSYVGKIIYKVCRMAFWSLSDKGYIYGGNILNMGHNEVENTDNWTGVLREYDPAENSWITKMIIGKRYSPTGFSLPGNGYAFAGMKEASGDVWLGDLDEWNRDTNTFSVKQPEPDNGFSLEHQPAIGYGSYAYIWSKKHFKWTKETDAWSIALGDYPPWNGFYGGQAAL